MLFALALLVGRRLELRIKNLLYCFQDCEPKHLPVAATS